MSFAETIQGPDGAREAVKAACMYLDAHQVLDVVLQHDRFVFLDEDDEDFEVFEELFTELSNLRDDFADAVRHREARLATEGDDDAAQKDQ